MVSNANTNPGLTKAWDPKPDKYYPTGARNYARVCTTDDVQGSAAAQFAKSIGVKSVYVLNDTETYGQVLHRHLLRPKDRPLQFSPVVHMEAGIRSSLHTKACSPRSRH